MKFTILFITLLSISSAFTKRVDDAKDKREALPSYPSTSGHYPSSGASSSSFQATGYQPQQSISHGDAASSINVGAGYSIGGAQPSYSASAQPSYSGSALQSYIGSAQPTYSGSAQHSYSTVGQPSFSAGPQQSYSFPQGLVGLQSGAPSIKLSPIKLQPNQGIVGTDLSQIMSQLEQSLNSGALTIQPSNSVGELHVGQGLPEAHGHLNYATPNFQQYVLANPIQSGPSYSSGTKGLSSYGSTGPVLFNPSTSENQGNHADLSLQLQSHGTGQPHAESGSQGEAALGNGYSFPGLSLGGSAEGLSYGGSSGLSLGNVGHSFGAPPSHLSGLSLGSGGHSLGSISLGGSAGHSFSGPLSSSGSHGLGHLGSKGAIYKVSSGKYGHGPHIKSTFKPSSYLGSVSGESSLSGMSHSAPSFLPSSLSTHGGHFGGFGSLSGPSKALSPLFTRSEGSVDSSAGASHYASPPATTYGFPSGSYSGGSVQSAAASGPQYYTAKFPSFGKGSFSYKVPGGASLSAHSSIPKYSLSSQSHGPSGRYAAPEDASGAYSETVYNTIKYSEELKPRA